VLRYRGPAAAYRRGGGTAVSTRRAGNRTAHVSPADILRSAVPMTAKRQPGRVREPLTSPSAPTPQREDDAPTRAAHVLEDEHLAAQPVSEVAYERPPVPQQLLFTTVQAAARLQVPASWLRKKTAVGLIPHTRLGRHVRYSEDDLAAIIRDGVRAPRH
jgi:excisionase family DNA binding protein